MSPRLSLAATLLWAALPGAAAQRAAAPPVVLPAVPAAVAPLPALSPSPSLGLAPAPVLSPVAPSAAAPVAAPAAPIAPALEAEAARKAVEAEVWRALGDLDAGRELKAYARANGVKIVLAGFEGRAAEGLDGDNLGQLEWEDRTVFLNWDLAAPDLSALLARGLPPAEAVRALGRLLAPAAVHELTHARLRLMFGSDFPGTREEEIVTHVAQARAFDELLRRKEPAAESDTFLAAHHRKTWSRWREGFGPLATYVLRKYSSQPSFDDPPGNARRARELLASLRAGGRAPPHWLGRLARAAALWEDPEAATRLTAFFQARIDAAAAR